MFTEKQRKHYVDTCNEFGNELITLLGEFRQHYDDWEFADNHKDSGIHCESFLDYILTTTKEIDKFKGFLVALDVKADDVPF